MVGGCTAWDSMRIEDDIVVYCERPKEEESGTVAAARPAQCYIILREFI
jgi:hypothetical protein